MAVTVLENLRRGDDFYIGKERFILDEVISEYRFKIRRVRDGAAWEINGFTPREVTRQVFAFGLKPRQRRRVAQTVKALIEAPPHVLLLSGKNYRKAHPESEVVAKATSPKRGVVLLFKKHKP